MASVYEQGRLLQVNYRLQCYVLRSWCNFLMEPIVLPLGPGLSCGRQLSQLEPVVSTARNVGPLYLWSLVHSVSLITPMLFATC